MDDDLDAGLFGISLSDSEDAAAEPSEQSKIESQQSGGRKGQSEAAFQAVKSSYHAKIENGEVRHSPIQHEICTVGHVLTLCVRFGRMSRYLLTPRRASLRYRRSCMRPRSCISLEDMRKLWDSSEMSSLPRGMHRDLIETPERHSSITRQGVYSNWPNREAQAHSISKDRPRKSWLFQNL